MTLTPAERRRLEVNAVVRLVRNGWSDEAEAVTDPTLREVLAEAVEQDAGPGEAVRERRLLAKAVTLLTDKEG